jgi:hemerythrin-like domain-containing protein
MEAVGDHIRQEEFDMFTGIRNNLSSDETEQLASQFKAAKAEAQQKMGTAK